MPEETKSVNLTKVSNLLSQTWNYFVANWKKFVLIFLIQIAVYLALGALFGFLGVAGFSRLGGFGAAIAMFLLYVLIFVWSIWMSVAMIFVVKDNQLTVGQAIGQAKARLGSAILIGILLAVIVTVGYLLLIVPGIIFTVWYGLVLYVLVFEGKSGWSAFQRSRELVRGYGWSIFIRLIVIMLIQLIVSLVSAIPVIGWLIAIVSPFILTGYWMIYLGQIYQDLVKIKSQDAQSKETVSVGAKIGLVILVLALMAVFSLPFVFLAGLSQLRSTTFDSGGFNLEELTRDSFGVEIPENINFNQGGDFEEFSKDTDGDGLPDFLEEILLTNPNNPDTDGDGVNDGAEYEAGTNPLEAE